MTNVEIMAIAIEEGDTQQMQACVCTAIRDIFRERAEELVEFIEAGGQVDSTMQELLIRIAGGVDNEQMRDSKSVISLLLTQIK